MFGINKTPESVTAAAQGYRKELEQAADERQRQIEGLPDNLREGVLRYQRTRAAIIAQLSEAKFFLNPEVNKNIDLVSSLILPEEVPVFIQVLRTLIPNSNYDSHGPLAKEGLMLSAANIVKGSRQ